MVNALSFQQDTDSRNEKADDTAFHSPRRITPLLMVLNSRYHFCYRNIKTKTVELFIFLIVLCLGYSFILSEVKV